MRQRSGIISLYNSEGVRLTHMRYSTEAERRKVLENWKETYGAKFYAFTYGITPDNDLWEEMKISLDKQKAA